VLWDTIAAERLDERLDGGRECMMVDQTVGCLDEKRVV